MSLKLPGGTELFGTYFSLSTELEWTETLSVDQKYNLLSVFLHFFVERDWRRTPYSKKGNGKRNLTTAEILNQIHRKKSPFFIFIPSNFGPIVLVLFWFRTIGLKSRGVMFSSVFWWDYFHFFILDLKASLFGSHNKESAKGQIISKGLFDVLKFFQKTNENTSTYSKSSCFRSFLGRIRRY